MTDYYRVKTQDGQYLYLTPSGNVKAGHMGSKDAALFAAEPASGPGPEPEPPPTGQDMLDFSQAVITRESPDVRGWPITTTITQYTIPPVDAPMNAMSDVRFSKRGPGGWPLLTGPEGGPIQYTLWVGCKIGGVWHFSGPILCVSQHEGDNYCPTGPTLKPGQLPGNWYYYAGGPLDRYQPQPGEQVAWLVTAGVQRRRDEHVVAERSNVIVCPFVAGTVNF